VSLWLNYLFSFSYFLNKVFAGAAAGGHGTRFLTQRVIPFVNNAKLIVTDVQGLDPLSDSYKDLAEDLQFVYIGLFSPHLLYRPKELGLFEREIEANSQHCIILLMSAKDVAENGSELNYMCQVSQELKRRQLPFLIVLTKADSLGGAQKIMDLVEKVENLSAKHRDFIFSVVNCVRNNENPSAATVLGIHAVLASVASTAKSFQVGFKITRGMRWKYLIKHNRKVYDIFRIVAVLAVIVGVLAVIVGSRGGLRAPNYTRM